MDDKRLEMKVAEATAKLEELEAELGLSEADLIRQMGESLPGEYVGKLSSSLWMLASQMKKLEEIVGRERRAVGQDMDVLVSADAHKQFVQYHIPDTAGQPLCHGRLNMKYWTVKSLTGVLMGELCTVCMATAYPDDDGWTNPHPQPTLASRYCEGNEETRQT